MSNETTTLTTTTDVPDLGTDHRYPSELAPFTRDQVREWVRKSLLTTEPRSEGVPPAFRGGVVLGLKDAFTEALPIAKSAGQDALVTALQTMLGFVELAGVEE